MLYDLGERTGGRRPSNFTSGREHVYERIRDITGGSHIDYFVVSHYHEDHVGKYSDSASRNWGKGIIGLLSDFSVPFRVSF